MESIHFVKGYDKVNQLEDQSAINHNKLPRKPLITVVITLIVLLTVVIGLAIGALIHESYTEPPESSPSVSTDSIRSVCSVTQFPDSCFTSITGSLGSSKPNPELILNISIRVAKNELSEICSMPRMMMARCNDRMSESALRDCGDLFDDALSRLNESAAAMEVAAGGKMVLTEAKIGDMKTWISSAMTDQETCVDGLEEMSSMVVGEMKVKMQPSREYLSNSLAFLSNYQTVLGKLNPTGH